MCSEIKKILKGIYYLPKYVVITNNVLSSNFVPKELLFDVV